MIVNPLVERDLIGFCRTKRWFTTRTVFVGTIVGCVLLFFLRAAEEISVGNLDVVGRNLFAAAAVAEVLLLVLLIPALCADLVSRERRLGTLDILLSTPLSATSIVLGKLMPRLALLLVLVAASFPPIAITLLFGGVRGEQVAGLFLLSTALVVMLAPLSLLISTWTTRPAGGVLIAYLLGVAPACGLSFVPGGVPEASWLSLMIRLAQPPLLIPDGAVLRPALVQLGIGVGIGVASVIFAIVRLRRERRHVTSARAGLRRGRTTAKRAEAFDRKNPMIPRESRILTGGIGRGPWWLVLFLLLGAESFFVFAPPSWKVWVDPSIHGTFVMIEGFLVLLFAALAGATSVIADRERGLMDQLRLSRLAPRDVVVGKTFGTFRAVAILLAVPAAHLLTVGKVRPETIAGTVLYVLIAASLVLLATMLGVTNSIRAKTVPQAVRHCLWHLSWFTVTFPLFGIVLGVLLEGSLTMPGRTDFSLLVPLQIAGETAAAADLSILGSFYGIFYLVLTGFLLAVLALHFLPSFSSDPELQTPADRLTAVADWRESWKKLSAEWEGDGR